MNISGILRNNYGINNQINTIKTQIAKNNEKLSSGKRVNSAADSPSDILRISRLNAQARGNQVAQRNIQDAISLTQVMDTALESVSDIGQKLRELSIQYKNEAISTEDKALIENEAKSLTDEIGKIFKNTEFNGIKVFEKNNYSIQTGANSSDKMDIKIPKFDTISTITKKEQVQVLSKNYKIDVKVPYMSNIGGNLTLDLREGSDKHYFNITHQGVSHQGILTFNGDKTGRFELNWNGKEKLTGTLNLNDISSKETINGSNSYKMDSTSGNWQSSVNFSLQSEQTKTVVYEEAKNVSLFNLADENISKILDTEFIDKNILNPIASTRSNIGVNQNILEKRLTSQINKEADNLNALSKIEDLDMAKELLLKTKNDMLLNTNISLFSQNLDSHKSYILQLLS